MNNQGESMQADEQPRSRTGSALRELAETILFTLLIYLLVRSFLLENYRVVGHSMDPTLEDEQYLVVNKLGYRLNEPQRGDIVVIHDPRSSGRKLIKRVIGLPGEVVEVKSGKVFINEQPLDEPYIQGPMHYTKTPTPIPSNQYYVLGDNRNNSSDSHSWGTLPREKIVGKAWLSYWPPRLWGTIAHVAYEDER
jgi:signal peptidase I